MLQKRFDDALLSICEPFSPEKRKFLLGVSGGTDSMCMAELFFHSRYELDFAIAHVNFHLRPLECDKDEALVTQWAENHGKKLFIAHFDTNHYASEHHVSIEMAARELRYSWFEKIMDDNNIDDLSIAHNLDDRTETFFLNVLRGTGMKGLVGIREERSLPQRGKKIIRPLLSFTRKQISDHIAMNKISYHDDMSNFETKFYRNKLRNIIFPEFKKINPSFKRTLEKSMGYFDAAGDILNDILENELRDKKHLYEATDQELIIDIKKLSEEKHPSFWLFSLINPFGFNSTQVMQILGSMHRQTGKRFFSDSHELLINRGKMEVYPHIEHVKQSIIKGLGQCVFNGVEFRLSVFKRPDNFQLSDLKQYPHSLFIDGDKFAFPIIVRTINPGDRIHPFGLKGSKKISDLFTDYKLSIRQKEAWPILFSSESSERIICIPGIKSDDRYKITPTTNKIIEVSII